MSRLTHPAGVAYDEVAAEYDRRLDSDADAQIRRTLHEHYALYIRDGSRVIDVGCGSGVDAVALARRGCLVTAIDASPEMVALTNRRAQRASVHERVVAKLQTIEALTLHDEPVDAIISAYAALNTQESLGPFAQYCARTLRPGGIVVIHVLNRWWWLDVPRLARRGQRPFASRIAPQIGGVRLRHHRFTMVDFRDAFGSSFEHLVHRAAPLFGSATILNRTPRMVSLALRSADGYLGAAWPFRGVGEFLLVVLRKRP